MRDDVNKDEKKSLIPNVFAVRIFVSKFKGNVRTVSRFCIREDKATTSWEFTVLRHVQLENNLWTQHFI